MKYNIIIFVIILLILGMIAQTKFGTAKMLADNVRVRSDLFKISKALESYYLDHHCYPGEVPLSHFSFRPKYDTSKVPITTWDPGFTNLEKAGGQGLNGIDPGLTKPGVAGLTTPVAYLTMLPTDPFINFKGEKNIPYAYHVYTYISDPGFIIWSPGPDKTYNITDTTNLYNPEKKLISKKLRLLSFYPELIYENKNGDIWSIKVEHWDKRAQWSD
jgi:hypothetical protein